MKQREFERKFAETIHLAGKYITKGQRSKVAYTKMQFLKIASAFLTEGVRELERLAEELEEVEDKDSIIDVECTITRATITNLRLGR